MATSIRTTEDQVFYRDVSRALPVIVRGEGVYLYDADGNRYLDGCAGSLVANIGHGNTRIAQVMAAQAATLAFTHMSRFTNGPAIELANQIAALTPGELNKVYFVSGGSEATESAMKLARQYFLERDGRTSKWKVIARRTSYHGGTLGALSMTGHGPRRRKYDPLLADFPHIAPCYCYRCPFGKTPDSCGLPCADDLERTILQEGPENVVAFIAEPIVGAAAGALVPPDGYFQRIREICDKYDVLFIADEVMTGFGRTGKNFAIEHWPGVVPDVMCIAKGMSAGYTPLGGIVVQDHIHEVFRKGSGKFAHGHTYGGNPLSCAVGVEVQKIMAEQNLVENSRLQGEYLLQRLRELQAVHPLMGDVRGHGLMLGVELVADPVTRRPFPVQLGMAERFTQRAAKNGLVVYPGQGCADEVNGDQFLVGPPLTITRAECDELVAILDQTFAELEVELTGGQS